MALNFTVSYTFSPNTTIASAQVNTNTSDVANVFTGLEAETKTLSKLKMDADPTIALEVATKQYVDHYASYRRPVLVYNSGTVVNLETGIDGTSGECKVLFPDNNVRTDSTTSRIQCNLAQVAALSGVAQSGLRTGSVASNTWYAIYAVKTSDNTANFVAVADTVLPIQANFTTLNSNFGTNSWVYIGLVRNGDNSGAGSVVLSFVQSGNFTKLLNTCANNSRNTAGIQYLSNTSTQSLTYTYSAGTSATAVPNNIAFCYWIGADNGSITGGFYLADSGAARYAANGISYNNDSIVLNTWLAASEGLGLRETGAQNVKMDATLGGWIDNALGVGSNPLL